MSAPLYAEAVIGYRSWTICNKTYRLHSRIIRDESWPANGKCTAECKTSSQFRVKSDDLLPENHNAPAEGCTCGIYGYHDVDDAIENYANGPRTIMGSAIFWGNIVVHTAGFRAQHCRIVALSNHRRRNRKEDLGWTAQLEGAVEKYNVPVIPLELLVDYTNTWGKPLGSDYLM